MQCQGKAISYTLLIGFLSSLGEFGLFQAYHLEELLHRFYQFIKSKRNLFLLGIVCFDTTNIKKQGIIDLIFMKLISKSTPDFFKILSHYILIRWQVCFKGCFSSVFFWFLAERFFLIYPFSSDRNISSNYYFIHCHKIISSPTVSSDVTYLKIDNLLGKNNQEQNTASTALLYIPT